MSRQWMDRNDRDTEALEPIGKLVARLRRGKGWSQARLAELLCRASGIPTISRHEVSRWEREERKPGRFWLEWLAVVLDAPLEQLEAAAGPSRVDGGEPVSSALWRPPTADELLAALKRAPAHGLGELAHAWLAGPGSTSPPASPWPELMPHVGEGTGRDVLATLDAELAVLRRQDDAIGGVDLARQVDKKLRVAIEALRMVGSGGLRQPAMRIAAGYAQLAGWVHADAGDQRAARRAYLAALRTATAAGDRQLAAHVLGGLAYHGLTSSTREALLVAQTGYAGARTGGSPLTQALLLHRIALLAAQSGERPTAELALTDAERLVDQAKPDQAPAWLYWLTEAELTAMTGRCLATLGRPLRAVRLLGRQRHDGGPRTAALYGVCLARSYLALGEVEQACRVADRVLLDAAGSGSVRAFTAVRRLHPELIRHRAVAAVQEYEQKAEQALRRTRDTVPQRARQARGARPAAAAQRCVRRAGCPPKQVDS